MPTEEIILNGKRVRTLPELLRTGLKAVIVGINPSPVSVLAGHYYQGQLGQRLWQRLHTHGILSGLAEGNEDRVAFRQGFGFTDLLRRPTPRAADLSNAEIQAGVPDLIQRLQRYRKDNPLILFVFKKADDVAGPGLRAQGWRTQRLPGPYVELAKVEAIMKTIKRELEK